MQSPLALMAALHRCHLNCHGRYVNGANTQERVRDTYIHTVQRLTWFGTLDLRGRFILDTPLIWFTIGWRF